MASDINPTHPKAGLFPSSFRPKKATVLWVLLLLYGFHPAAHGQVLQDAPFTRVDGIPKPDRICVLKETSSILILREDNEEGPSLCYQEYDRHGRILKRLDQHGDSFDTYQYPSQGTVLQMAYRPTKNQKFEEGWHLNFPENFAPAYLYRIDVDEKGNWYRRSIAKMPIVADTSFEVMYERTISYYKDSIITLETGILRTCWNRRSVFDPDGKFRSELLLPSNGECLEEIYCASKVYKSAPHTWTIIPAYYGSSTKIKARNDGQPKKFLSISLNGERDLMQKNFFRKDGLIKESSFHYKGLPQGTITFTYNEKGLLSVSRFTGPDGRRISTRYQYVFF